ncbi:AraC family transcriptional regulator [Dysgonomonas sp. 216]|nr:AraC family transcriptional regulator [Dysgonomonas sp. 216]
MEQFDVIYPSPLLSPYIKHYWTLRAESSDGGSVGERTIPTGCISLVFHRASRMYSSAQDVLLPQSFVSGQSSGHTDLLAKGRVDMIVVVFQPAGGRAFFDIPMNEFVGQDISLEDIGDPLLLDLADSLFYMRNTTFCIKRIEQYFIKRLNITRQYNFERLDAVIANINNKPKLSIGNLADICCLSSKQFDRIFGEYVGTNPKEFLCIVRFQRALFILQSYSGLNLTQLALECGYYDQSHMINEFKRFSGYSPREYMAVCNPYSDYFFKP